MDRGDLLKGRCVGERKALRVLTPIAGGTGPAVQCACAVSAHALTCVRDNARRHAVVICETLAS